MIISLNNTEQMKHGKAHVHLQLSTAEAYGLWLRFDIFLHASYSMHS